MKFFIFIFIFILNSILIAQSTADQFEKRSHSAYGKTIPYRLFVPKDYQPSYDYPLVLILHGSGERGSDNAKHLVLSATIWAEDSMQAKYPCIVVAPQCPSTIWVWWPEFDILSNLIMSLMSEFSIDSTRLYMTGYSMGAIACWHSLTTMPIRFAAIVPLAGYGVTEIVPLANHIPAIWGFNTQGDETIDIKLARKMIHTVEDALGMEAVYPELRDGVLTGFSETQLDSAIEAGTTLIFTEYAGGSHTDHIHVTFTNTKMHRWLFKQSTEFILPQASESPVTMDKSELYQILDHPVLEGNGTGWDELGTTEPAVILDRDTLKMWYVGRDASYAENIGYAWSLDGISWNRSQQNPVLLADLEWEDGLIENVSVIKDGDIYKMWYCAGDSIFTPTAIGYAESADGVNWVKNSPPVLLAGELDDWDYLNIGLGTVIKEGETYKMWYHGGVWPMGMCIGLATSTNGINWTKYNDAATTEEPYQNSDPVLFNGQFMTDWDYFGVWFPLVLPATQGYQMWYSGSTFSNDGFIYYATSADGIHWSKSTANPIFYDTPPWLSEGRGYSSGYRCGSVVFTNNEYHLWYSITDYTTDNGQIGYAKDLSNKAHTDSTKINALYLPGNETLIIQAWANNPYETDIQISANVLSDDHSVDATLMLHDDGNLGDMVENDGIWTANWPVPDEELFYTVDVTTTDQDCTTVYHHYPKHRFTSAGPVNASIVVESTPNPRNVNYRLSVQNRGQKMTLTDISVQLTTNDGCVQSITNPIVTFPDIGPGETKEGENNVGVRYYSVVCANKVDFDVNILYKGDIFWHDIVTELEDHDSSLPYHFALFQNYPNPFNPKTMINFQLPVTSYVTITIYNLLGQKVATLVNKKQPAGSYQVQWDASGFASGIYIYQLKVKGQRQNALFTKKLVLLK